MSPFAHLLHALRLQHGIRQAELATLLGYEQSYISALEVGIKGPPTDEFVDRLVQGLQLTQGDEMRLRDAVSASQRKLVIDRDTPEDGYWLLKELREQFESLSPRQIRMLRDVLQLGQENEPAQKDPVRRVPRRGSPIIGQECLLEPGQSIPERRVHELIGAGKIIPLASPGETRSARWYLPKVALQALMFSGTAATPADSIALSSVLRGGRLDDGEFIAIVNGLQNGELSTVGVVPCPIGRVAVSKQALDEFRLRWTIQHHRGLSIDQAANLLELKQQVTYQLARLGLLRTDENPDGRLAVSMAQIQRFQRKYASLQSIAKRMNTSPRAALAHISATPVAGPSMHNCRQYFFRRSDVAGLLEDQ